MSIERVKCKEIFGSNSAFWHICHWALLHLEKAVFNDCIILYLAHLSALFQMASFINCKCVSHIVGPKQSLCTSGSLHTIFLKSYFTHWDDVQEHLCSWWAQFATLPIYQNPTYHVWWTFCRVTSNTLNHLFYRSHQSSWQMLLTQWNMSEWCVREVKAAIKTDALAYSVKPKRCAIYVIQNCKPHRYHKFATKKVDNDDKKYICSPKA